MTESLEVLMKKIDQAKARQSSAESDRLKALE